MFGEFIQRYWPIFTLGVLAAAVLIAGSDTHGDEGSKQAPAYPNLDSQLNALLEAFEGRTPTSSLTSSLTDVTIYVTQDIDAVADFLTSNGASVRNMGSAFLEASVPIALLGQTSQLPNVIRVEQIIGPHIDIIPGPNPPTEDAAPPTTPPTTDDAAPPIPPKAPQRFANLTSDLDSIAQDVDAGVFSVDSLVERALLHERPAGADRQSSDDDTTVGVTIYALEDIGPAASFLKRSGVAIRHQRETYLEAYVPVGLLGQASLQPDVIRIEPIVGPWEEQMADPCIVDLGSLTAPATRTQSGSWTGDCDSENRSGRYARYYTFELALDSVVTIDLTSSDANAFLYLMRGSGKSGSIVALGDDGGDGNNARIVRALQPGQYTIEATTLASAGTGSFTLELDTVQLQRCAAESLGELSRKNNVHRYGPWTADCASGNRAGKYGRYYSFTLSESTSVTISMTSSDVGASLIAYLIDGTTNWYDNVIGVGASRQYNLRPGTYMIEATTAEPEPAGAPSSRTRLEIATAPPRIITSEGALRHGTPAWNDIGITGASITSAYSIKVGIIDGGFSRYDSTGSELPSLAGFKCYLPPGSVVHGDPRDCAGSTAHGTAVTEALIDIAPDASIYIANPRTLGDLQDAVDWMISQGVEVINHSASWGFDGPGDGTSPRENSPLRSVDRAVDGGITWVNSAGNYGRAAWLGEYSDTDGDGYIEFHGNDARNTARSNRLSSTFQLRWEDSWTGADTDLDLYVLDSQGRTVASSEDLQTGRAGHVPYEGLQINTFGREYQVVVRHTSGDTPRWIQLLAWGATLEHHTLGSIGNPAESSNPGLLAVGAAPWFDVETIEPTSSRGPTPDGRIKPDIVGVDGALSTVAGGRRIFGTSQAAPHVAGMAALVRQQYPRFTAADVARYLRNQALPRTESDGDTLGAPNNVWGYGFAYLPPPPIIPAGHPLTSPAPDSDDQYGISSAMSSDGSTLVIGSLGDTSAGEQAGAAYVFIETMVNHTFQGKLTASDGAANDNLGASSAMSSDGATIALGAPGDGSGQGSVYVFTRPSATWASAAGTIKLTASDGAAGDGFGASISMSSDGSTLVVGAHGNDDTSALNVGAAYVFTRPATGWATSSAGVKLTASDAAADDAFGTSVSTNSDGSIIIVGASGDDPGSVYVFARPATGWAAAAGTTKLTGPTEVDARAHIGGSVSISGDGSTIVAGSPQAPGAAYVFTMPTTGWTSTSTSARLTAPDGDSRDQFGRAVSTNADGSSIAVAATNADSTDRTDVGAVYMFTMPTTGWASTSDAAKLQRFAGFSGQDFGHSVSLSPNGSKLISTSPNDPSGGHANYFDAPSTGWIDVEGGSSSFIDPNDRQQDDQFGHAVAVSADESTVVVGANNDDATATDAGAIYVFTKPTGGWESGAPTRIRLLASDGAAYDGFGRSVAVSSNGSVIAVGANGDDDTANSSGSVYVFTRPSSGWASTATAIKLNASDPASGDQFGNAVAISGDGNTIVVGASRENSSAGAAYVYTKPATGWAASSAGPKLTTADGSSNDQFGGSVSVNTDGSVIVVGASGSSFLDRMSDGAYVFTRPATGWAASSAPLKITPNDGNAANAQFGSSVAVSGDGNTIVIGAQAANGDADDSGAAYVYTKPATGWTAAASDIKLTSARGAAIDYFGESVAVNADGGRIAIGAPGDDNDAINSGGVYLFTKPTTGWIATSTAQRLPVERASGVARAIGRTVSIGGTLTAVGASAAANQPGSAFVYRPTNAPTLVGTVADQSMTETDSPTTVNVASNFSDPDSGTLSYTIASSNAAVATAAVTDAGVVTITVVGPGETTISVTATNPYDLSATQSFITTVTGTPALIQDLNAVAYSSTGIDLTWTVPHVYGRAITGYNLERKAGTGSYSAVTPAPTLSTGNTVTYRDSGLTAGTTYTYRVQATDSVGPRGWSNEAAATPTGDRDALIAFYDAAGGATWTNNTNWKTAAQHDRWHGVTTDFNGRVTQLRLVDNGLQGTLSTQLENLPNLQVLHLGNNSLSGTIPTQLSNLSNLRQLYLHNNRLSGTIPTQLSNLSNLQQLHLNNNSLSGTIPTQLSNLSNLRQLYLNNNSLSGTIPTQLGNLSNLQTLHLHHNQLTGSIPAQLGNLDNLLELHLNNNQLTGSIPMQLGNLNNLQRLMLMANDLTGAIPEEIGNLSLLQWLYLDENGLTGAIPEELGNLSNLQHLYLHDNQLTGAIPTQLGNLSNLQLILMSNNELSGAIPSELGNLSNLREMHLYNNQLTGAIPPQLGKLNNLRYLGFNNNDLSGTIPSELGRLSNLRFIILNDNRLTGSIPAQLGGISSMRVIILNNNQLTGSIPSELGTLPSLRFMILNNNGLTGSIPAQLGAISSLQQLILNNNQLTESIPSELGNLPSLRFMTLNDNRLTGSIPAELGNLNNLLELHLDNNQLTGAIPSQLGNLSNLRRLHLDNNQLTGAIPSQLGNLSSLQRLYLNNNQLTGAIPSQLGNLENLQYLYFNTNDLSGPIPKELGNLNNLLELFFQENHLSGQVPPELGNLSNLTWVHFHDNELTGHIPTDLGKLDKVLYLCLRINQLTGPIPEELGNLSSVKYLYLNENNLSGPIPEELGNLDNLELLYLQENGLSGPIPEELGNLSNLQTLYLQDNMLTGPIPEELGNLSNLEVLYLQRNRLTGTIPTELKNLSNLQALYLNDNILEGTIPSQLGNLSNLQGLYLNDNMLEGTIPRELGNLSNLLVLYLNDNMLEGGIPPELGNLSNLLNLFLNTSGLSGPIPPELGNLSKLGRLKVHENDLTGPIPPELGKLSKLWHMEIYDNNLSGPIPPQLGNLASLRQLYLHRNNLSGPIPPELGNLNNLRQLYLHRNNLSGPIPPELENLNYLGELYLNDNDLSGPIPPQLGNLNNLWYMALNDNDLSGPIPPQLGNLNYLGRLYLNNNGLSGQVPSQLGNLNFLQQLRLNDNDLKGEIPQALTRLTRLTEFHFDENTGRLCAPSDDAFQTWLSGISDRRGLTCGSPAPTPTPTQTTSTGRGGSGGSGGSGRSGGSGDAFSAAPIPISAFPEMIISTDTLAFTAVQDGDDPAAQTVSVWNALQQVNMSFTVSSETEWLSFSPASAASNSPLAKVQVQVSVDASGLTTGTHNGSIVISATDAVNSPRTVSVTLTISVPTPAPTPGRTTEDMRIVTSDSSVRVDVPAGAAREDVEIRITTLDVGAVGSPPGAQERVAAAVDAQTFVDGAPTPMTYPDGVEMRFALPEADEAACAAGRVRVYRVNGEAWTRLAHRCETDDAGGAWAVTTLTHFSTYVMVIDDTPPTPTPTAVPTATPTPVPTATNTPVPTATYTPTAAPSNTPMPTATHTPTAAPTNTPVPTATHTPTAAPTNTPVPTATHTPTATRTPTATNTPVPTATPPPTATHTPVSVAAAQPEATASPTPTAAAQPEDEGGGANVLAIILVALLVIAAGVAAVIYLMRRQEIEFNR